ncbi:MAG: lipopolysaccharide biosynthesis protein [Candidatus Sigynarchaeum springense]
MVNHHFRILAVEKHRFRLFYSNSEGLRDPASRTILYTEVECMIMENGSTAVMENASRPAIDRWEKIGYHRVIGGFYFYIIFAVVAIGYVLLLPVFIPYPESMGFYNILTGIFSSFFTLADLGTASSLARFIAEYRVKDPQRTIEYIRFFIWFQMFTGLAQTTVVSFLGLFALGATNISYMPWLFVWLSIIQFPGMLGTFMEAMKGFQQYAKTSIVSLINTVLFQSITLALGAQLGAYLGNASPQIGGVMGAAIGMTIGYYVDDFSTVMISGWMFSKMIKPWGFKLRDAFIPHIRMEIARDSIKFGIGVMAFVLSYQIPGTLTALLYTRMLPNYSTLVGIMSTLGPVMGLAETVNTMHIGNHQATTCEAYFNKKQNYAEYILSNGFRTIGQVSFMIIPLVLVLGPAIVDEFFHDYISTFNRIFIVVLVHRTIFQHSHLMNEVLIGTGHHKFNVIITIVEQIVGMTAIITCIYLQLGIYILIIPGYLSTAAKQGAGWVYITRRIIPLHFRKAAWQNWISTAMAGFVYYWVVSGVFTLLGLVVPVIYAAIACVVLGIYVLPGIGYFFPLALLGGYDKHTLEDFKNAVALAGPSKIVVVPWYKCASLAARISPLHDKFPMYYDHVGEEIEELMAMKAKVDAQHS